MPIVTVSHPVLTPEEREKRIQAIREAIISMYFAAERAKREKKEPHPKSDTAQGVQ